MASRPKLQRFRAAMTRIAEREGFEGPEAALLWALSEIEAGVPVARLWTVVQEEAGETSVRGWAYTALYSLAADARQRVREARRIGAAALADEALEISDRTAASAAEAASNRLAVDTRKWLAGVLNRDDYGDGQPKVQVALNMGALMLDAFRQTRVLPHAHMQPALPSGDTDVEVLPSGESNEE
jgi:hypothetical protein